jgi:hypothetical protein
VVNVGQLSGTLATTRLLPVSGRKPDVSMRLLPVQVRLLPWLGALPEGKVRLLPWLGAFGIVRGRFVVVHFVPMAALAGRRPLPRVASAGA